MVFQRDPFGMDNSMFSWGNGPTMFDWFGGGYQPRQNQYRQYNYPPWHPMYEDYEHSPRQYQNRRHPSHGPRRDMSMDAPMQRTCDSSCNVPMQQTSHPAYDMPTGMSGEPHVNRELHGQQARNYPGHRNRHENAFRQNSVHDKKASDRAEGKPEDAFEERDVCDAMENSSPLCQTQKKTPQQNSRNAPDTKDPECKPPVGVVNPVKTNDDTDDIHQQKTVEVNDNHSETKSLDHMPQLYKKLKENEDSLDSLKLRIDAFSGTAKDKEYLYIDEMLTKVLLSLDAIETDGIEEIRNARKKIVRCVQELVSQLENKVQSGNDGGVSKPTPAPEATQVKNKSTSDAESSDETGSDENTTMDTSDETDDTSL